MLKFKDYVLAIYERLLDFEREKEESYGQIVSLQEFLAETDRVTDEIWQNLGDTADFLLNEIVSLEETFIKETENILSDLDDLETKIEDFIDENEEITVEIKENLVDLGTKINHNYEGIKEELAEWAEIVNNFEVDVRKFEPDLTDNLNYTSYFLSDVILNSLEGYQNFLEVQSENLSSLYAEDIFNFLQGEILDIREFLDDIVSGIQELNMENNKLMEEVEFFLVDLYADDGGDIAQEYEILLTRLEEVLGEGWEGNQEVLCDRLQAIEENVEKCLRMYDDSENSGEALINILARLLA